MPCIDCGQPSKGKTRCKHCFVPREKTAKRGYGSKWQQISQQKRSEQPFCSKCGQTVDLTVDHIDGNQRNNKSSNLQVLCRSCHSKKDGGKRKRAG